MFDDNVWEIIKSYLFDKRDIEYRLFINQMNRDCIFRQEKLKWKRIRLMSLMNEEEQEDE